MSGPAYGDLVCHRARHEDGGWYCAAHGLSWPCSPETSWRCVCGSGDGGEWHTAACAIHNTPDEIWSS